MKRVKPEASVVDRWISTMLDPGLTIKEKQTNRIDTLYGVLKDRESEGEIILNGLMYNKFTFANWYSRNVEITENGSSNMFIVQNGATRNGLPVYNSKNCKLLNHNEAIALQTLYLHIQVKTIYM